MRCVVPAESSTCNRCRRLRQTCEFRHDSRSTPLPLGRLLESTFAISNHYESKAAQSVDGFQTPSDQVGTLDQVTEPSPALLSPKWQEHDQENHDVGNETSRPTELLVAESGDLLSIYSTSPVTAVADHSASYDFSNQKSYSSAQTPGLGSSTTNLSETHLPRPLSDPDTPLSLVEIKQLTHM
jgi:hypothetical protein